MWDKKLETDHHRTFDFLFRWRTSKDSGFPHSLKVLLCIIVPVLLHTEQELHHQLNVMWYNVIWQNYSVTRQPSFSGCHPQNLELFTGARRHGSNTPVLQETLENVLTATSVLISTLVVLEVTLVTYTTKNYPIDWIELKGALRSQFVL